jgi:GT2 family glycosyltransferase
MMVDIVLLSWNFPDMTLKCLKTLRKETHIPYTLIWIDNGSERENFEKVKKYVKTFKDHIMFRFDSNRYYAESTNKGIKLSTSKYVVTLSNDVFVTKGWLGKIIKILEDRPEIGLISPLTDNIGSNWPRASMTVPKLDLLRPDEPYEKINDLPSRFTYCEDEYSNVSMFCAVLRKAMIDEIGLLDERFPCYGNDFDYNERIKQTAWKTAVALNCFVFHLHKATKNVVFSDLEERAKIRRDHALLLSQKREERARQG